MTVLLSIFFVFNACNKDDLNLSNDNKVMKDVLTFGSFDEFSEELTKVISMSSSELKRYEENKGYKSLGRAGEELYHNTDFEKFTTKEEIFSFVEKNKNLLNFIDDGNGELELETILHNFPQRYLLNIDQMVQIDTIAFKFLNEGVFACDVSKIDLLHEITSDNISSFLKHPDVMACTLTRNSTLKYTANNCGTSKVERATSGRDRTKIDMSIGLFHTYDNVLPEGPIPMTILNNYVLIRPYKRTLGVWYWCSRTISWDLKIAVDKLIDNNWERGKFKNSGKKEDSKVEFTIEGGVISFGTHVDVNMHYGGLDCWAKTPSTGYAKIQCNTSIAQ